MKPIPIDKRPRTVKKFIKLNPPKPQRFNSPGSISPKPLIIESESYKELDFLIYVSAEKSTRIKRVLERDPGRNEDDIVKIIKTQMNDKKAINFCDEVIENNENNLLLPKVLKIHEKILKKSNNFKW